MKSIALLSAFAIAAVAAQTPGADEGRLFYTEPSTGTVWQSGGNATISWSNVCDAQNAGNLLSVVLYIGTGNLNGTEQQRVPGINSLGKIDCTKQKSIQVLVPANLTTSNLYSVYVNTQPLQSYSAPFTIRGIDPPVVTSAVVPPQTTTAAVTTTTTAAADATKGNGAGSIKTLGTAAAVLATAVGALFF